MFFFFPIDPIVVTNISDYISKIKDIRDRLLDEGSSEHLYFRGQANLNWDIIPSIFRNSWISVEEDLIEKAISRVPSEFTNYFTAFEELTKLQHYGLPTRLLDVTMNPLVALYFACCSKEKSKGDKESKGVVYYGSSYPKHCNDIDVRILSSLAKMKLTPSTTLYDIKEALKLEDKNPEHLIQTLQSHLFVMPKYSNNRLVCQSGAFLLVGAINIEEDKSNIWNSKVCKSFHSMNSAFYPECIVIPEEYKDSIIEELDFLNINEATLFPELEHQMSHIKRRGLVDVETVPNFLKFEYNLPNNDNDINEPSSYYENKSPNIHEIVNRHVMSKEIQDTIYDIIRKYTTFPDWDRKDTTISALKTELKRAPGINDRQDSKLIVEQIVSDLKKSKES